MLSSLVLGAALLAGSNVSLSMAPQRARLAITWTVTRGDHVYRLRGRYAITGVSEPFATSIANDTSSHPTSSVIDVPPGLYRVTLEAGYTLERSAEPSTDAEVPDNVEGPPVEVVPASLLSLNPVLVTAGAGGVVRLGLSLVDMPGTASEPEPTCMNGS